MSESTDKLEKIAATIRNLLARAEDPRLEHEPERQAFRNKAEELMLKYRIEEENLIAEDQFSILPVVRTIKITNWRSDFYQDHHYMWVRTIEHTGCRYQARWNGHDLEATVIGYASDIRHAEALYQAAWLVMVAKLEPTVDPKLSDAENVYRLRSAGIERNRVAEMLWGSPLGKDGHAAHAKVGKLYASECQRRGEKPVVAGKGVNKMVFRSVYGEQFASRYAARLREARDAADSVGGGLVLKGRQERVDEAFYAEFPEEHPDRVRARREAAAAAREAKGEGEKGKAISKRSMTWTKKDQADYERRTYSAAAQAGYRAGRDAADAVEIQRTTPRAQRVETAPEAESTGIALGS